jgi:hypothetical protein
MDIKEVADTFYDSVFGDVTDAHALLSSLVEAMGDPTQYMNDLHVSLNVPTTEEIAAGLTRAALAHSSALGVSLESLLSPMTDAFVIGMLYERSRND